MEMEGGDEYVSKEGEVRSGGVDCTQHHKCEGDGNCIGKKRITFVVRLKILDSPKSRLHRY